jgi:hypothetical protein
MIREKEKELLKFNPNYFDPLDDEEKQLINDLENGVYDFYNEKKQEKREYLKSLKIILMTKEIKL